MEMTAQWCQQLAAYPKKRRKSSHRDREKLTGEAITQKRQ
jgi:hypothetical protein